MSGIARWAMATLLALTASIAVLAPAAAQVDCRNGKYCPQGNACLKDGLCGVTVETPPGSTKTSTGSWCEPGFREHQYRPGSCVPSSYSDCTNGAICPPGTTCSNTGTCTGGGAASGPECGTGRCGEGRICASGNRCMNPVYYQDCGGSTICSKNKACGQDGGCATVGIGRTEQIPYNRRNQNSLQ